MAMEFRVLFNPLREFRVTTITKGALSRIKRSLEKKVTAKRETLLRCGRERLESGEMMSSRATGTKQPQPRASANG
jgi:hypothetical protein